MMKQGEAVGAQICLIKRMNFVTSSIVQITGLTFRIISLTRNVCVIVVKIRIRAVWVYIFIYEYH